MNKTLKILEELGIKVNHTFDENGRLIINGNIWSEDIKEVDKDFLKDTTINGGLYLDSLKFCDKYFLKNTTINGFLSLNSLRTVDKDFLKNTTINGDLYLGSLESVDKDFLKDTTINGDLYLRSLKSCDKDFLKNTTINGGLYFNSLKSCDKDFLKNTVINGFLSLSSLKSCDKDFLKNTTICNRVVYNTKISKKYSNILENNPKKLTPGYNKEKSYCYFDRILSKVINVSEKQGYTIYKTPFDYVVQKGEFTAHAKTVKQGIIDVRFKEYVSTVKHDKLKMDDEVSSELYRAITGACYQGMKQWMQNNGIEYIVEGDTVKNKNKLTVRDVYDILKETQPYGYEKFKKLIEDE